MLLFYQECGMVMQHLLCTANATSGSTVTVGLSFGKTESSICPQTQIVIVHKTGSTSESPVTQLYFYDLA